MPRGRGGRSGGGRGDALSRSVTVSKALSRLLRHAAVQERIPIDSHGYVRMDHLLNWQRLRSMKPAVSFAEVVDVVRENEKKRFALKFIDKGDDDLRSSEAAAGDEVGDDQTAETETNRAIAHFESSSSSSSSSSSFLDPTKFFIRATQGHSMEAVESENLLVPVSLADPASVPQTVVHGTFYGAWDQILRSGGLKRMRRNHVHFATGPALSEVLPITTTMTMATMEDQGSPREPNDKNNEKKVASLLGANKPVSGMRSDAQILIYIDIRRALAEEPDMKWWRSENGVILTDGVATSTPTSTSTSTSTSTPQRPSPAHAAVHDEDVEHTSTPDSARRQTPHHAPESHGQQEAEKLVPTKYFLAAVEVKEGIGLLLDQRPTITADGEGTAADGDTGAPRIIRELPDRLKARGVPRGKGGGAGGGGRGRGRGRGRG